MLAELKTGWLQLFELEFGYPWVLWCLALLPMVALYQLWPRRSQMGPMTFTRLGAFEHGRGWKVYLTSVPTLVRLLALSLVIVAVARPHDQSREERRVEGIDIFLILDMSGSMGAVDMTLAEVDRLLARGETPKNRFQYAVETLDEFIERRRERCNRPTDGAAARCDRIGMVVFGRDAFLEFPSTLDYGTILNLLKQRELEDIDGSGTAIGDALARATAGLRHSDAESKVVVLITDGDRRGGEISPEQAATMANHFGITTFPVLVGREGTTLLPTGPKTWGLGTNYQQVEFPVNPRLLQKIATMTNGKFYHATDKVSLSKDLQDILDQFERSELEGSVNVSTTERYRPYAFGAVLLLLFEASLSFLVIRKFP